MSNIIAGLFENIEHRQFHWDVPITIEGWLGLSRSISYVQSIGPENLANFESEFRESLSRLTAIDCRYRTDLCTLRPTSGTTGIWRSAPRRRSSIGLRHSARVGRGQCATARSALPQAPTMGAASYRLHSRLRVPCRGKSHPSAGAD